MGKSNIMIQLMFNGFNNRYDVYVYTSDSPELKKFDELTKDECLRVAYLARQLGAYANIGLDAVNKKEASEKEKLKQEIENLTNPNK